MNVNNHILPHWQNAQDLWQITPREQIGNSKYTVAPPEH